MAFDGVIYHHADLIYPAVYHPKSPLTGPALGDALRAAYLAAHRRGRRMIDQNYTFSTTAQALLVKTSFARIAEGYRRIPDEATHLVGEAVFGSFVADDRATAFHRVKVFDGVNTDTGSTVETSLEIDFARDLNPEMSVRAPQYSYSYRARFDVTLANVAPGAGREIYVEAYATRTSGAASPYFPEHISVWWEIR